MNFTSPNYTLSIWHIRRGQHFVRTLFRNEIERGQGKNVRSHHHRYFHYQRYLCAFTRQRKTDAFSSALRPFDVHGAHQYVYDGFSSLPARQPFFKTERFPELNKLTENWLIIREEALRLQHHIKAAENNNDAGFNTFFKRGWKRFYLKWYADAHPSAQSLCPVTTRLVSEIPSVKAAMFAELPAGAKLGKHRDPYAGSVRYHLGLFTPNDDRCFIEVDGQRHSWRDGEAVIFDETYVHWAENKSDQTRIILFCDIERPMKWRWAQAVNHWVGTTLMSAASSPNDENDSTAA